MKISLELDAELNIRLKKYALDTYGTTHGKQQAIIREALVAYLDQRERKTKAVPQEEDIS